MNPRLYLTAEGLAAPSAHWPCLLWSLPDETPAAVTLAQAARAQLARVVDVVVPMDLCTWVRTEPWPLRRPPGGQAIAFAVEEHLSEALENLHLAVGTRDPQGRYPVMAIDRERFSAVLALLNQSGIAVGSVHVDADLLPGDQPLGVRCGERWLIGAGLPARLALTDDEREFLLPRLPDNMQWLDEPDAIACLLSGPTAHAIDLRTGAFARRKAPMPWCIAGLSLLLLTLFTWGGNESRARFWQEQTRVLATQNEQRFHTLYPDQRRAGDLGAQLKGLQIRGAQPAHTHMAYLVSLMDRVIGASSVEVQRIEFQADDGWKVQLTAHSFAELEHLRERGRQLGMPVGLDRASQHNNRVQVTLTAGEPL